MEPRQERNMSPQREASWFQAWASGCNHRLRLRRTHRGEELVDIETIARTTHRQPLLYQVATGIISEGEIAPPTRVVLRQAAISRYCSAM